MRFTVEEICRIAGAAAEMAPAVAFEGYSIDSRMVGAGDLFFAIAGENFDGHDFVGEALTRGAAAAVVRRGFDGLPGTDDRLLFCDDPLDALHALAAASRLEEGLRVVGITGSCGKTTTKDILAAMIARRLRIGKNAGNLNNIWGLPLAMLRRPPGLEVYVCEMGMSYAGELRTVTRIARPDVAVFTNIHGVHLVNFPSVEAIAAAKAEMLEGVPADGAVVANADDPQVMRIAASSGRRLVTFGRERKADVAAAGVADRGIDGLEFDLRVSGRELRVASPLPGIHNLENLLAALATGIALGLEPEELLVGLDDLEMSPWRSRIVRFEEGFALYDDAYNSNPEALGGVLATLARSNGFGRRLAVLGDMLELGDGERQAHRECGAAVARCGVDLLIAVGPLAAELAAGAREAGMERDAVVEVPDSEAAVAPTLSAVRPGDLVLVKGSRGVKMETVVAELTRRFRPLPDGTAGNKSR